MRRALGGIGHELVAHVELLASAAEERARRSDEVEDVGDRRILLLLPVDGVEERRRVVAVVDDEL